ncbi:MAG: pyruvate kinase [Candidatus Aminicenantes bacterium]|nr:pyruvate kinase [Candidatus Aminicenantes bacterium]
MIRTKIVCTIGPASRSPEMLNRLVRAGMDVARLNFSHGAREEHGRVIADLRRISRRAGRPVAVLQDLAGPKIRIGPIRSGPVFLKPGASFILTARKVPGDARSVSINYPSMISQVRKGDTLLLSDGALELEVVAVTGHDIRCRVVIGGPLSSFKGINLPARSLGMYCLTPKDRDDLLFGLQNDVDYVALSFVRNAGDVAALRRHMKRCGGDVPVIAKIEKHEAVENMDAIVAAADGIMVARGDLGVETPLEKIPQVQKTLIRKSREAGKPVITATQMLRSMIDSPRPTRAEVSDVANAILDGTDAVMLSEETAVGKFPVEAVSMMVRIAREAERRSPDAAGQRPEDVPGPIPGSLPCAVACAATRLAADIGAAAVITFTQSGGTARLVSRCRPEVPILAHTPLEKKRRQLALSWGVIPVLGKKMAATDEMIAAALKAALKTGLVRINQTVVITAGVPPGVPGTTNLIKVERVK